MGMGDGLIRFSVGLDNDIARTWKVVNRCLREIGVASQTTSMTHELEVDPQSAELVTV
jgi:methionine-gamma-lyase